jgi:hypothetical protein
LFFSSTGTPCETRSGFWASDIDSRGDWHEDSLAPCTPPPLLMLGFCAGASAVGSLPMLSAALQLGEQLGPRLFQTSMSLLIVAVAPLESRTVMTRCRTPSV